MNDTSLQSSLRAGATLTITPRHTTMALSGIILILLVAGSFVQIARWHYGMGLDSSLVKFLDLEGEKNLPALLAGLQLLLAAASVWLIQRLEAPGWYRRDWRLLGIGLATMAFDEVFSIHERLIEPTRSLLGGGDLGVFTYAWVVPGLIVVTAAAVYFLRFLNALPARTRVLFLSAGAIFVGGAVGMEMLGGWYWSRYGDSLLQSFIVVIEEAMEFFGVCLFIHGALGYLATDKATIWLEFRHR